MSQKTKNKPLRFRQDRFIESAIRSFETTLDTVDRMPVLFLDGIQFDKATFKAQSQTMINWLRAKHRRRKRKTNVALAHWLYLMESMYVRVINSKTYVQRNIKTRKRESAFVDFTHAIARKYLPPTMRPTSYNAMAKFWEEIRPSRNKFRIHYNNRNASIEILISAFFQHNECDELRRYLMAEGFCFVNAPLRKKRRQAPGD